MNEKMPSRFFESRSVRGAIKMKAPSDVLSRASSYSPARTQESTAYEGTRSKALCRRAAKGGRKPRVKKKFQCTPYSETCSA